MVLTEDRPRRFSGSARSRADETAIEDVAASLFFILGGPLWFIEIFFLSGRAKHGLLWRPLKFQ